MVRLGLACGLLFTSAAFAQDAALEAPDEATIGSGVEVRWSGPGNQYDSVYVIAPEAPDEASGLNSASITSGKNPVVVLPDEPGDYELRYWDRLAKKVLARRAIRAVDVPTSLDAPERARMGESIAVAWTGPGNSYEWIGLFAVDAGAAAEPTARATVLGRSPVQLHLPETPGAYELRYVTRQSGRVLATRPITIEAVDAGLDAPETALAGATIEVTWEGPGNQYDRIALYTTGAADDAEAVRSQGIVSRRNPVQLRLPEEPGDYELRYVTRQDGVVLARRPIRIGGAATGLIAPERATASTAIEVEWAGPGNDYDAVGLFAPGAADDAEALALATILRGRNPVILNLPDVEGEHELRYRTTQEGRVLARRPIVVEPAGRLEVVFERQGELADGGGRGAVELILDASGSMLQRENGTRRIAIARQVLTELVREHLGEDRDLALRVFGHKEADACRTDLEIPLGRLDREAAAATIASVDAMNLAKTPIAASLAQVPADLAGASGPKTVVLITDGEETCDGDPAEVLRELRAAGFDAQVSIVGFAIDDADLKSDFESWAELGGGAYFDARSADELAASLRTVISGPFRVLDASGSVVARGVIGGAEVVLPVGVYRVETVGGTPRVLEDVEIRPRETTRIAF